MSKSLCILTIFCLFFLNENFARWLLAIYVGELDVTAALKDAYGYFSIRGYLFSSFFRAIPYALLMFLVMSQTLKNNNAAKGIGWVGLPTITVYNIYGYWRAQHAFYTSEHVSSTTGISFIFIPLYSVFFGAIACALGYGLVRLFQRLKNYT